MIKLVLVRHGESVWNLEDRFTGWTDVDLSPKGIEEARAAGKLLKKHGFEFDQAFTSVLRRAIRTFWLIQEEMECFWLPTERSWRLNERHYGALQGLNKTEMRAKYGEEQVHIWRRSYSVLPPLLEKTDPRWPGGDRRYASLKAEEVPCGESLELTVKRLVPYWESTIAPTLKSGKRVIIAAHGNSIRALVKYLDHVSDEDITQLNIPTGSPLVYELDEKTLKPIKNYYLK